MLTILKLSRLLRRRRQRLQCLQLAHHAGLPRTAGNNTTIRVGKKQSWLHDAALVICGNEYDDLRRGFWARRPRLIPKAESAAWLRGALKLATRRWRHKSASMSKLTANDPSFSADNMQVGVFVSRQLWRSNKQCSQKENRLKAAV